MIRVQRSKVTLAFLVCIISIFTAGSILATNTSTVATTQKQAIESVDIHYISTGNSDCILISDNGKCAMIDGADNDDEEFLIDYLNNLGIKGL